MLSCLRVSLLVVALALWSKQVFSDSTVQVPSSRIWNELELTAYFPAQDEVATLALSVNELESVRSATFRFRGMCLTLEVDQFPDIDGTRLPVISTYLNESGSELNEIRVSFYSVRRNKIDFAPNRVRWVSEMIQFNISIDGTVDANRLTADQIGVN